MNAERKVFYQLCWHLGGSQGDIACLKGEDVDWKNNTVSFTRKKTKVPVIVRLVSEALNLLKDLPAEGPLLPYLASVHAGDRATEFRSRCRQLEITGVTLHSYSHAWAERALKCGYPERFAMENLGHNSKAVHRAYAKRALMNCRRWKNTNLKRKLGKRKRLNFNPKTMRSRDPDMKRARTLLRALATHFFLSVGTQLSKKESVPETGFFACHQLWRKCLPHGKSCRKDGQPAVRLCNQASGHLEPKHNRAKYFTSNK